MTISQLQHIIHLKFLDSPFTQEILEYFVFKIDPNFIYCYKEKNMKNKRLIAFLLTTLLLSLGITTYGQTTFPGTGTGPIPDATACAPSPAAPLVVSFTVTGISAAPTNVKVDMTFGTPTHTWMGDIIATLTAPNGTQHVVFGRTGSTTATAVGDSSDLSGLYSFENVAVTNWWTTATAAGAAVVMPTGNYRTSATGNVGQTGAATDINAAFAAIPTSNGTWTLSFTDGCNGDTGSISSANLVLTGGAAAPVQHVVDYNGDGRTDYSVVRNNAGQLNWLARMNGSATTQGASWGLSTDIIVSGDFDGDAKSDVAVWRLGAPNVASFYILNSNGFTLNQQVFGQTGDDPTVVADYDGDGRTDVATYRAGATAGAQSFWYFRGTSANPSGNITYTPWGSNGDFPAPGDYDGNGRADFSVQRPGASTTFYTRLSTGVNLPPTVFGLGTDVIVPGDYDGDGKTDIATTRVNAGAIQWQWQPSSGGATVVTTFGVSATDRLTQGDYDGDGKTDPAVWRPGQGFYALQSTNGASVFQSWGTSGDFPVANYNTH